MPTEIKCPNCGNKDGMHMLGNAEITFDIENGKIETTTHYNLEGEEWEDEEYEILSWEGGVSCQKCDHIFEVSSEEYGID